MNTTAPLGDRITQMEADLDFLQSKSNNDDGMIALLKQQLELAEMSNSKMAADHAEQLRVLRMQRDQAVRVAKEVQSILDTAANGIMSGLRKMRGDEVPAQKAQTAIAVIVPPAPEPAKETVVPSKYDRLLHNELPAEITQFAPPLRLTRPSHDDPIDDGLRQIVGGLDRVNRQ